MTLHNVSRHPEEVKIRLDGPGSEVLENLLAENQSRVTDDGRHHIAIEEFGYRWYRVGGLSYALNRGRGLPESQSPKESRR
jgi:maltose alpha-D-glucosyltransferase/alpha-amylase